MADQHVLWVSTSTRTRGGVATFVRTMQQTPLWARWGIRHVATHRDGSRVTRSAAFVTGTVSFLRELVFRRPAVVHLHTASYGSFARKSLLAWSCRAARVPVVLHVHGGAFGDFHAGLPAPLRRYVRATLDGADRVIGLGSRWAAVLRSIAPGAHVMVVPNAVRPRSAVAQPAVGEPVQVLFVGELTDAKGAFVLLEAWRGLSGGSPVPRPELVVVGPGDMDRARETVRRLGLADQVRLTGWVPPTEVERLLGTSHVLVLPSRAEGQPMAVLEAMARGLCVVATDVGGIPDLVDEECGVLVPVDDPTALGAALRTVITDAERRSRLGARALARVRERFDVDLTWRQFDELYEELTR